MCWTGTITLGQLSYFVFEPKYLSTTRLYSLLWKVLSKFENFEAVFQQIAALLSTPCLLWGCDLDLLCDKANPEHLPNAKLVNLIESSEEHHQPRRKFIMRWEHMFHFKLVSYGQVFLGALEKKLQVSCKAIPSLFQHLSCLPVQ